jgi:hypothetical protein
MSNADAGPLFGLGWQQVMLGDFSGRLHLPEAYSSSLVKCIITDDSLRQLTTVLTINTLDAVAIYRYFSTPVQFIRRVGMLWMRFPTSENRRSAGPSPALGTNFRYGIGSSVRLDEPFF